MEILKDSEAGFDASFEIPGFPLNPATPPGFWGGGAKMVDAAFP